MATIVLIGCSSRKLSFPARAQDLYSSSAVFRYSLAYAQRMTPDGIFILSAKYGLLKLEDRIEPYDVTLAAVSREERAKEPQLKVLNRREREAWGERVRQQLVERTDPATDHFVFLAAKAYIEPTEEAIPQRSDPLAGMRQGERLAWLQAQLA